MITDVHGAEIRKYLLPAEREQIVRYIFITKLQKGQKERTLAGAARSCKYYGYLRGGRCSSASSEIDGVVAVSDRVELFVAVLNAEQNLGGVAFIRRRNLDDLETALERTVFFDRLAILARRSRADTLNFTARQSRFQDVGRV